MLSIPMRSLRSFLDKVQKQNNDSKKWIARYPVFTEQHNEDLPGFSCEWHDYSINDYPWLIAINPCYAHYSPQLGLVLGEAGGEKKQKYRERDVRARYHYRCETFQKHLSLVFGQHKKMEAKNKCALRYLSNSLNIPAGVIKKAVQMALLFHDIGKLSKGWQGPAKAWQEYKTPGCVPKEPLAHTDYDPDKNDWVRQKEYPKRANHAVEGAFAIHQYLYNVFESQPEIAACIFTAIARHHSGWASSLNCFSLIPSALDVMNDCLRDTGFRPIKNLMDNPGKMLCGKDGEFAAEMIIALYDQKWLPLYYFIVRCLRLSDQAGTMEGGMS